jgi:putative mRNA 3-end processing factor
MTRLLEMTPAGLYCAAGGFHIDPWQSVDLALITHVHADHARPGSRRYLCAEPSLPLLGRRLGETQEAELCGVAYGEPVMLGTVRVSFHPAGHVLGSAQVRIAGEGGEGEVVVVSGDYKRAPDPTCAPFEAVPCDTFVTEATFALPIYRWDAPEAVAREILDWWDAGVRARRPSVLFCYSLGKAQRILAELARLCDRRVLLHGAMAALTDIYRQAGVALLPTELVSESARGRSFAGELILAPPVAMATPWMRRFADAETAFASGWMRIRGTRRRRGVDRGFVLSDHADWPALLRTIEETGARRVLVTHGYKEVLARVLREVGREAEPLATAYEGEMDIA